jgi:hypothetical protein
MDGERAVRSSKNGSTGDTVSQGVRLASGLQGHALLLSRTANQKQASTTRLLLLLLLLQLCLLLLLLLLRLLRPAPTSLLRCM